MKTKLPADIGILSLALSMTITACGPQSGSRDASTQTPDKPVEMAPSEVLNVSGEGAIDLGEGYALYPDTRAAGVYYYLPDSLDFEQDETGKPAFGLIYDDTTGWLALRSKIGVSPELAKRLVRAKAEYASARITPAAMSEVSIRFRIKETVSEGRSKQIHEALDRSLTTSTPGYRVRLGEIIATDGLFSLKGVDILRSLIETPDEANRELVLEGCYTVSIAGGEQNPDQTHPYRICASVKNWDSVIYPNRDKIIQRTQ